MNRHSVNKVVSNTLADSRESTHILTVVTSKSSGVSITRMQQQDWRLLTDSKPCKDKYNKNAGCQRMHSDNANQM